MFEDVLVPTDGSDCASVAVDYAADIAERYDATLHVLSVLDSRRLENAPQADDARDERAAFVDDVCEEFADAGPEVVQAVRTGVPHEAILEYADEESVDLIVMGTHGRTGVERYLLGSVAEQVLRLSDVPVLTVRTADTDDSTEAYPFESVLVPTDGSEGAEAAIDPAVDLARPYGAALHALSVVDTTAMGIDVRSAGILDHLESDARSAVEAVADRAEEAGLSPVETAVGYGTPYRAIRDYVEDEGVDLVVMGTHGRSGVERYLLGSVAEKLVRTSPVPVLTVRIPEAAGDEG